MVTDNPMPRPFCGNIPEVREDSRYPFGFDGPVPAWEVVCITLGCPVWNADNTYYVVRGKATPGSMINPAKIEVGAAIWMKWSAV